MKASVFGIELDKINSSELIDRITSMPDKGSKLIGHVNVKGLNLAYDEARYRDYLKQCCLIFCDGIGVILGAKLLGHRLTFSNRMTCPDYLSSLLFEIVNKDQSIYFLAGRPDVMGLLNDKLKNEYPALKFRTHHGHFNKEGLENHKVIQDINEFSPDILYVGFGMPLQEYWLMDNMSKMNAKVFLPLGACLDFYTGEVYRGPRWLTDNGFEWLTRFLTEPGRLWERYVIGNPLFLIRVILQKIGLKKF